MKSEQLLNDYTELLKYLENVKLDLLDMDEVDKAEGLRIACEHLSDLIKFHRAELKTGNK